MGRVEFIREEGEFSQTGDCKRTLGLEASSAPFQWHRNPGEGDPEDLLEQPTTRRHQYGKEHRRSDGQNLP